MYRRIGKFYSNSKILIAKVIDEGYVIQEDIEAREEAKID